MAGFEHDPLTVLMTADTVGGVWTYCMELCRSLPGVHFHLVTAGAPLQPWQHSEADLPNLTLHETSYKLEWMSDAWDDMDASGAWLLELEEEIQPGIIHLNSYSYGSLPFRAPKLVVAHSDVFSWWRAVKGDVPPTEWNTYFEKVKQGLESVAAVIAPSHAVVDDLRSLYTAEARYRVIYNGRSNQLFRPAEKQDSVMSMGRIWDEAKNVRLLAAAAPQIPYSIKIAGDNSFENSQYNPAGGRVEYLGKLPTEAVAKELSTACVYVLPARYEPFGLSVLEAALSGCALVLGNIPSQREIWKDTALYVNPDDATGLAEAVNGLMEYPKMREAYAQAATRRAQEFSSRHQADQYLQLYHQLSGKKELIKQEIL
jgi:glycosyltransferase involved in cell wall biosynthesis